MHFYAGPGFLYVDAQKHTFCFTSVYGKKILFFFNYGYRTRKKNSLKMAAIKEVKALDSQSGNYPI